MATAEESFIVSSDEDEDAPQSSSLLPLDKDVMAAITFLENNSTPDGETTTVDGGTEANGNNSNNNNDNKHNQHCVLESPSTANPTTIIESSKGGEITRLENRVSELEDRLSVVISQLVHFSNHTTTSITLTPPITASSCNSNVQQQQQQQQQGGVEIIMHSRVNSETSCCYSTPDDDDDDDDDDDGSNNDRGLVSLSQWPPSHHCHLESPDSRICPNRQYRKQQPLLQSKNKKKKKGKTMSMVLLDESNSSYDNNYHGPRYLMPSSSDLDACDEDEDNNIDDNNGTNKNKSGGELKYGRMITDDNNDDSGGITSTDDTIIGMTNNDNIDEKILMEEEENDGLSEKRDSGSNNDDGRGSTKNTTMSQFGEEMRSLLLSPPPLLFNNDNELEHNNIDDDDDDDDDDDAAGITATTIDERIDGTISPTLLCANDSSSTRTTSSSSTISPCNSTSSSSSSSSSTVIPPPLLNDDNLKCQAYTDVHLEALHERRKQSMDIADNGGNFVNTPKNVSTQTSFAELPGMLCDNTTANNQPQDLMCDQDPADNISNNNNNIDNDAGSSTASVPVGGKANSITQSTSSASNLSLNTTTTSKTGNHNNRLPSRRGGSSTLSGSFTAGVPSKSRPRSASCAIGSTTATTTTTTISSFVNDVVITTNPLIDSKTTDKVISPNITQHHPSSHDLTSIMSNTVPVQSMREYVINDLLNIDSRNQDGSATEDVDENMEEFLRIPPKLEGLMLFSLAVCMDSFLYIWSMLPLKFIWGVISLACSLYSPTKGVRGVKFHRRHLYPLMQSLLIIFVYSQVLCPISIGKLYHWIRGQAMLKLYVLIAIVEVFDRLLCSFGQDAWDSLYWNTTRRPCHLRTVISVIVVGVYVTIHSLFLFVHVATLSVAVNSADNALLTILISGNFAEIKSTVFKKYNKSHLFKITTSDICERFKLALFLLLILFLNRFQGEMTASMVDDYYTMCGIVLVAELISDWIKHSFITKFNLIKSSAYFDYALVISGDVTGIGHEGLNLDSTHAAVKRLGLAQIPLACVTARYLHEALRFAIQEGDGNSDRISLSALADLIADGNRLLLYMRFLQGMMYLILLKILLGMFIRVVARSYLGAR